MRRIRRIHVLIDEGFYNKLEHERKELNAKLKQNIGISEEIRLPRFTELIARQKSKIMRLNIGAFKNAKQKRRCF